MTAPAPGLSSLLTAYIDELRDVLARIPPGSFNALCQAIVEAYRRDAQIFIAGNGGSAATATHFACDLSKNTRAKDCRRARVVALTDNVAALTAWANDDGYENVFAEQLACLVKPDDLLVVISGGGNSPNVLAAVDRAAAGGAQTVALTGFAGGRLAPRVDHALVIPCDRMEIIEDAHLAVCHALTAALRAEIAATLSVVHMTPQPELVS